MPLHYSGGFSGDAGRAHSVIVGTREVCVEDATPNPIYTVKLIINAGTPLDAGL